MNLPAQVLIPDPDIQPSVMLSPGVAEGLKAELPFEFLQPQDKAAKALKELKCKHPAEDLGMV